ncbi:hypothetical protein [Pseudodesulfovibrio sp.]|uniref:hypothetical protein n=1 Tax=unclassified Pseudodesulfovibrio TaxID=2661612 RepID=UPI003B00A47A
MTFRSLIILACFYLVCATSCMAGDMVLLHSSAHPNAWTQSVARGLCGKAADCRVEEFYLGSADQGEDFFEQKYDTLCPAWCGQAPDAVVADGEVAFAFVRKYRGEVFGDAPVVYLGMGRPEEDLAQQCGRCSGVPLRLPVEKTVDLVFRLRPDTTMLVCVMDDAVGNEGLRSRVEAAMEPYLSHASLIFPGHEPGDDGGLDGSTLAEVASSVPVGGAVLFLHFVRDNAGNPVDEGGTVRMLASRSRAPVFVLTDRFMDSGVLGGVVARGEDQGRLAAELAARLAKEPAEAVRPESARPETMADLTVLARFGIPADRLPKNTEGLKPPAAPEESSGLRGMGPWLPSVILIVPLWLFIRRLRAKKLH